jgi:hypothetical protein
MVDEINQGMDQINERKVFIQLVEAACRAGTPQCFMFTPKLLPDLPYTRDVTPMLIFNGAHTAELALGFKEVRPFFTCFWPLLSRAHNLFSWGPYQRRGLRLQWHAPLIHMLLPLQHRSHLWSSERAFGFKDVTLSQGPL